MRLPDPWSTPPLTIPEAGRLLGMSRASAFRAAATGDLPTVRLGRQRLVPVSEVYRIMRLPLPARVGPVIR